MNIHPVLRLGHVGTMLIVHLPAERILINADLYSPPRAGVRPARGHPQHAEPGPQHRAARPRRGAARGRARPSRVARGLHAADRRGVESGAGREAATVSEPRVSGTAGPAANHHRGEPMPSPHEAATEAVRFPIDSTPAIAPARIAALPHPYRLVRDIPVEVEMVSSAEAIACFATPTWPCRATTRRTPSTACKPSFSIAWTIGGMLRQTASAPFPPGNSKSCAGTSNGPD